MKRGVYLLLILLLIPLSIADSSTLYLRDELELQLDVDGKIELIPENGASGLREASAELLLYPHNDIRQTVLEGIQQVKDHKLTYKWLDQRLGTKNFGYTSKVKTKNVRQKVNRLILFPVTNTLGYDQYLQSTETIDSNHPKIVAKATELAEGETDLFKVVFNLANWVDQNVKYDLNSLTAKASQKASWVLENKQGVCDEMTSLFIAMARSLGIPARFVKGISYTNAPFFNNPWQAHGWAEVYFPEIGWVSFDVTFGEYGYIDVTHIKLRDGFDPQEADTKYEWIANNVRLEAKPLDLKVKVVKEGDLIADEVQLKQEILSKAVDFGSYNLIKGILKNNADYYIATTLQLAVPSEIKITDRNKRTILLAPQEERETFWVINVPADLSQDFIYNFPCIIYSEKNVSVRDEFTTQLGKTSYSLSEIKELTVQDEKKVYSRHIRFNCDQLQPIKLGKKTSVNCKVKNTGNTNLNQVNFCLAKACEIIDLPINQEYQKTITVSGETAGWNKVLVSAENEFIEKRSSVEFAVLDDPEITLDIVHPEQLYFRSNEVITINVGKKSFSSPKKVEIVIKGFGIKNIWEISDLNQPEKITLPANKLRIASKNRLKLAAKWQDEEGNSFSTEKQAVITGKGNKFKLFLNTILNIF